jgi:hypothetical protein
MKLYRIYTEDKNRENVHHALIEQGLENYTFIEAKGVFEGKSELSLIIEYIGSSLDWIKLKLVTNDIKQDNQQQCVLLTSQDIGVEFI